MASTVPFKKVKLTVEDVPGAQLPLTNVNANSVVHLRRYLQVRGIKVPKSSKKEKLIEMVNSAIENNVEVDPSVDQGKWLMAKGITKHNSDINSNVDSTFDVFPISGWKKFPSLPIPILFSYGIVYKHIIETARLGVEQEEEESDEENTGFSSFATSKPLMRGKRYFIDGHVQEMTDALSRQGHYCLKGKVRASMRNDEFIVLIMLDKDSAVVLDAECHCKASAMGRCSHVCALLLALEDYTVQHRFDAVDPIPCTSVVCQWNKGRQQKSSEPVYKRQYSNTRDPGRVKNFRTTPYENAPISRDLLKYSAQSTHQPLTGWDMVLDFEYEDYTINEEREAILKTLVGQLQQCLTFGFQTPTCVEGTTAQSKCNEWWRLRSILITASNFSKYLNCNMDDISAKLDELLWTPPKHIDSKYLRYGIENEERARQAYCLMTGNSVAMTGLWINPAYPGLGASPDGIVTCSATHETGILEIKCSYLLRNNAPTDIEKLSKTQKYSYCLKLVDGKVQLSRNHKYFKQIQMQMGVTGYKWCDFVVWTPQEIYLERVYRDCTWWDDIAQSLLEFHSKFICPEYFEMRVPRGLPPIEL